MDFHSLITKSYPLPTPAGSFHLATDHRNNPFRWFLGNLLSATHSLLLNSETARAITGCKTDDDAAELIARAISLGWIEPFNQPHQSPKGALEVVLPQLLANLSSTGKALLADGHGFYVANHGLAHETAEQLSALAADLLTLGDRHGLLLHQNMKLNSGAWGVIDAAGNSQIGFWPLYIGRERFTLVIGGMPLLNNRSLTTIIWALTQRYGEDSVNHNQANDRYSLNATAI